MNRSKYLLILLSTIIEIDIAGTLECYNCSGTDNVNTCVTTVHCTNLQSCFLNTSGAGYILGCTDNEKCGALSHVSASLVGRDVQTEHNLARGIQDEHGLRTKEDPTRRDTQFCFECCSSDVCNKHLCDHLKPSACIDDAKLDCAWLNSQFNICQNIHEAKLVCPKFCGLCNLVDGGWAYWSAWSSCDVTCANGTLSRTRQCSNPAPVSGGLDCPGSAIEVMNCSLAACPVDGNWTEWSPWSSCGVTCGNGTQTRNRVCSNPAPAHGGQMCPGGASENKTCLQEPCPIHGGWTAWHTWEHCSVTCDIGIQLRHRNCSNPIPQLFGDHCFGDSSESRLCTPGPCLNGGWSSWDGWSPCSVSCGGGFQTRSRTCSNPRPSSLGRPCEGDTIQVFACNSSPCLTPTIVFNSRTFRDGSLTTGHILVFTDVTLNAGNGYDNQTGIFTAPLDGIYSFSTQLCIAFRSNICQFGIFKNNMSLKRGYIVGDDGAYNCYGLDTVTTLKKQDRVCVQIRTGGTGSLGQNDVDLWNTFSGYLIHV